MNQRQLDIFKTVMEHGSFRMASKLLNISAPAVSSAMKRLEENLGFKLFERGQTLSTPTPEAVRFFQGVERYFSGPELLEAVAAKIRNNKPLSLTISATQALSAFIFPPAIKTFRQSYPDTELMIECFSSSEILTRIQGQQTNLGILQSFPEMPGIIQEPLIKAAHVCALHKSHPLAKKVVITPQDFHGEDVLKIVPSGLGNWDAIEHAFQEHNIETKHTIAIQNSNTGYSLINAGLAIGLIEPFAAPTWLTDRVVIRRFSPAVVFDYVLAYSSLARPQQALCDFREMARRECLKRLDSLL
ncbi:LysR family transcriptional regulator [Pseudovibrio sp. Ad26]|uniref:LysR family transcriptional regulator n=1 Tax=Pseudovibrio sp. Ad26 TaxID=989410 RepID=UPI0007AE9791|nr:LysR family transcriptional regulator [Pseudovibrio sp. Ad26]KZL03571.1 Hydrogen peroxide-inducible genes activator [Pseudovibrio sp. Ad26]